MSSPSASGSSPNFTVDSAYNSSAPAQSFVPPSTPLLSESDDKVRSASDSAIGSTNDPNAQPTTIDGRINRVITSEQREEGGVISRIWSRIINLFTNENNVNLVLALSHGKIEEAQKLLDNGANINFLTLDDLLYLVEKQPESIKFLFTRENSVEVVKKLVENFDTTKEVIDFYTSFTKIEKEINNPSDRGSVGPKVAKNIENVGDFLLECVDLDRNRGSGYKFNDEENVRRFKIMVNTYDYSNARFFIKRLHNEGFPSINDKKLLSLMIKSLTFSQLSKIVQNDGYREVSNIFRDQDCFAEHLDSLLAKPLTVQPSSLEDLRRVLALESPSVKEERIKVLELQLKAMSLQGQSDVYQVRGQPVPENISKPLAKTMKELEKLEDASKTKSIPLPTFEEAQGKIRNWMLAQNTMLEKMEKAKVIPGRILQNTKFQRLQYDIRENKEKCADIQVRIERGEGDLNELRDQLDNKNFKKIELNQELYAYVAKGNLVAPGVDRMSVFHFNELSEKDRMEILLNE